MHHTLSSISMVVFVFCLNQHAEKCAKSGELSVTEDEQPVVLDPRVLSLEETGDDEEGRLSGSGSKRDETVIDRAIRPRKLSDYVGQSTVR